MRKCPRCGLLSPERSVRCECGFHFDIDDAAAALREHERWRESARHHLFAGLGLMMMGVVTSIVSYLAAVEKGGYYSIWIGAFIAGGTLAGRSYGRLRAIREAERPLDESRLT
jgi:hypothetical protein